MRGGAILKKKSQLVGGILLMILGLGVSAGSVAFRYFEHGGMGPFNMGHKIVSRYGMNGNYGFRNPQQRGFNINPNFQNPKRIPNRNRNANQAPTSPSSPNQTPNQK